MTTQARTISILNLTGELTPELVSYFSEREVKVVDPLLDSQSYEWTHILTKDIHEFSIIRDTYKTLEKDIKIVSLTSVDDLQSFIFANGKLVFDEIWLKNDIGSFILDKFFQEYGGISLNDNYPKFQELGSFNITNPFSTGEYLDRMVHHAFSNGMNGLGVKTFFDHLLMYLTGLKNKEKVGFPFEVTFGTYGEVFGVQIHFFTDQIMLEDITSCLSTKITKKPEEYLLNVSVQSSDFFDFTFFDQVKKAVITGLWTKDERVKFENRGLLFTHLSADASITGFNSEEVTSNLIETQESSDHSERVRLPENNEEITDETKISGEKFADALAQKISSSMEIDKVKQIVSGELEEEVFNQLINGSKESDQGATVVKGSSDDEDDVKIKIGSQDVMDDIINAVKGKVDEEKSTIRLSGNKLDVDNFAFKVSSGLGDKIKGDDFFKSKILGQKLPESVKAGLFNFAARIGKTAESLTDEELETFKNFELPSIIKQHATLDETNILSSLSKEDQSKAKDFYGEFKSELEKELKDEFHEESLDKVIELVSSPEVAVRVKEVLKQTLKKTLDEKFHLSEKSNIDEKEQELLVKALTSSLAEEEEKIRTIISTEKSESRESEVTPLFEADASPAEKRLRAELDALKDENTSLKSKIKTIMNELKVTKNARSQFDDINQQVNKSLSDTIHTPEADADAALREHFQQKLNQQKALTEEDCNKLAQLLERETKLVADIKEEEVKVKKLQLEATQKEAFFIQEMEKSQRQIKAKDLIVAKTKDSLVKITDKKDYEIHDLHQKLDQMTKLMASNQAQNQVQNIKDLERKNINLNKMLDVYKNKLSSLANNMNRQSTKSDDGASKEEIRRMQMQINQFKNQAESAKKDVSRLQEKNSQDTQIIISLKQEKSQLEQLLRKATLEVNKATNVAISTVSETEMKKVMSELQNKETQIKELQIKNKDLEQKISEISKVQKPNGPDDGSKARVNQLEGSVKKLTQDLIESRNQQAELKKETNKLRQEKTGLQNQLDKLKKEMEKASKGAAPKKNSGGKAA